MDKFHANFKKKLISSFRSENIKWSESVVYLLLVHSGVNACLFFQIITLSVVVEPPIIGKHSF